jgi:hypothetical protein
MDKARQLRTRNSFDPESSLLMSNAELRGENVIWALSFLEDFERYGFDTYKVPVDISKPSDLASVIKSSAPRAVITVCCIHVTPSHLF